MRSSILWKSSPNAGVSLVGAVIAVGITGIVALMLSRTMTVGAKGSRQLELNSNKEALKLMLLSNADCQATLPTGTCTSNSILGVRRKNSASFLISGTASSPTRIGRLAVKAQCNSTGDGVVVRTSLLRSGATLASTNANDFLPHPVTKQVSTWDDDQNLLFPAGLDICSQGGSQGALVDVRTSYRSTGNHVVTAPATARKASVMVYMNFTTGFGWNSEDTAQLDGVIDLETSRWSGLRITTGGNGNNPTQAVVWNDAPFGAQITPTGDTHSTGHNTHHWMGTYPSINFNTGTRVLTLTGDAPPFYNGNINSVAIFKFYN